MSMRLESANGSLVLSEYDVELLNGVASAIEACGEEGNIRDSLYDYEIRNGLEILVKLWRHLQ